MPISRLSTPNPVRLRIAIAPQPWPDRNPVTLTWSEHQLIAAVHPGTRGYDLGLAVVDGDAAPDWVLESWFAGYGIHAPAGLIRAQWRALIGGMAAVPAYTRNLPPQLR